MLLIDDAQHADTESLQAISTLVRHQSDQPVLVVLATVSADRLPADLGADEIRLTGLTVAAVGELMRMRGISVHPAMAETLSRHTDGNPRDVLALLDEVPPRCGPGPMPCCRPPATSSTRWQRPCSPADPTAGP